MYYLYVFKVLFTSVYFLHRILCELSLLGISSIGLNQDGERQDIPTVEVQQK